jgi:hypothetical protein
VIFIEEDFAGLIRMGSPLDVYDSHVVNLYEDLIRDKNHEQQEGKQISPFVGKVVWGMWYSRRLPIPQDFNLPVMNITDKIRLLIPDNEYRFTWWSILDVAESLHGVSCGSCEGCLTIYQIKEHTDWLKWRLDNWQPSRGKFDDAIQEVCKVALEESEEILKSYSEMPSK